MNRGRGFTPVAASAWKKLYLKRFAGGGEATSGTRFVAYDGSMVIDPWGTVIARARETPGVTLAEIDLDFQEEVRARIPSLRNRRPDVYELRRRQASAL